MKIHKYNEMMRYLTRPKDKKFVYEPWANKKVERLNTGGAVGAVPEAKRPHVRWGACWEHDTKSKQQQINGNGNLFCFVLFLKLGSAARPSLRINRGFKGF